MAQVASAQQFPFVWEGTDKKGKRVKGKMLAVSVAAVKADLRRQGVLAKKVRKEVQLFKSGKKITSEDIALFARQLATMLHMGAVIPNLSFAADAHYHHLEDDVIQGGRLPYSKGAIAVPTGPDLGVRLDREKLGRYHEEFKRLGSYPYDQDPLRPGWSAVIPNDRWADPTDGRAPKVLF